MVGDDDGVGGGDDDDDDDDDGDDYDECTMTEQGITTAHADDGRTTMT